MSRWRELFLILCAAGTTISGCAATYAESADNASQPDMSGHLSQTESTTEAGRLKKAGEAALVVGNYQSAERLFLQALKAMTREDDAIESSIHGGLAEAYGSQGKLSKATGEMKRALSQANKRFGIDSLEAAKQLDNWAWLTEAQGKLDKAQAYCQQALDIRSKQLKADNVQMAESLEHMGWIAEHRSMYDDAANYYKQALPIRSALSGQQSIAVADVLERLAAARQNAGNAGEARPLFKQSIDIKEAAGAVFLPYQPERSDERIVFRFQQGAPNCQNASTGGSWAQRISANGVTVEASYITKPSSFVKTTRINLRMVNQGQRPVPLLTQPPLMVILSPELRIGQSIAAEELARTIEKKGESKANSTRIEGENATRTTTTTVYNPHPYQYVYSPYYGCVKSWSGKGEYATVTTEVPDYAKRQELLEKAEAISEQSRSEADAARRNALGPTQVRPGGMVQGSIDFDQYKFDKALIQIPVGNTVFEFNFDNKR